MSQIDEIDFTILEMLERDGRKPFTEMAEKLRISEATVRKRVLALEKNGIIKKFTIRIDPARVGFKTVAIVGLDVDPSRLLSLAQSLCSLSEIKCVATSSGDHMIMLEIWTKNSAELARLVSEKIEPAEGVKRVCPALILEKLKD